MKYLSISILKNCGLLQIRSLRKQCRGFNKHFFFKKEMGTSLVDQQLRLLTFTAGGMGLIPGQGTKVPPAGGERETE